MMILYHFMKAKWVWPEDALAQNSFLTFSSELDLKLKMWPSSSLSSCLF